MDKENKIHWISWENMSKPKKDGGLGFRDLYSFNLAMLAKQAWRIMKNPTSLCARVLKAKYFPERSLLDAEVKSGISYSWRSILKGVQVLKKGIIWRVGNGQNIKIWADPWLPRDSSRQVRSRRGNQLLMKVSDLINPISLTWDTQLIQQTFNPEEASIISMIPIQEGAQDSLAWHYDKKGLFSVKSAYQVVRNIKTEEEEKGSPSFGRRDSEINIIPWKKLWALPLPGKLKHFLWRLANNSLPLRMKLKRRGVDLDTRCPVCFRLDEDGGHIFFKCKAVRAFWRAVEMEDIRIMLESCPNAKWVIIQILKQEEETCIKICTLLWTWWLERNRVNQGQKLRGMNENLFSFQLQFLEFREHLRRKKVEEQKTTQVWSPPPECFLKINTDGAFREASRSGGWGFIIRNERGEDLVAGAGKLKAVSSPLHAEALAMYHAITKAATMGCQKVILETDATILKQAMTSQAYDDSELGMLFKELKMLVRQMFQVCKIVVCPRACNNAAHSLAAVGVNQDQGSDQVWFAPFPCNVSVLIAGGCLAQLG